MLNANINIILPFYIKSFCFLIGYGKCSSVKFALYVSHTIHILSTPSIIIIPLIEHNNYDDITGT